MEEDVVCKKGKCEYKDESLNEDWKEECTDCELDEQIEHELNLKLRKRTS